MHNMAKQIRRSGAILWQRGLSLQTLLFVGAFLLLAGPSVRAQQEEAVTLAVSVIRPAERQWPETISTSGWLKPWHEAVIASEIAGLRIVDVLADVGTLVTKGQPLVRLAQDSVQADLRKRAAAVDSAQADLDKARTNADRVAKLRGTSVLSDEKITEYIASEQSALASLASAKAGLEAEQIKLNQTTILAVDDGLITSRSAQLGAVVASGTELFRLVRQQRIEWQAEIPARLMARIKEGQNATVTGPEGRRIEGQVRLAGPSVNTDTGRALVYVALPVDAGLRVGTYAEGVIALQTTPALTVPETALVFRDGFTYLFALGDDNRVTRLRVETGRRRDGEVEILSGLERSAKLVSSGGAFLSNNAKVKVEGGTP